MNSAMKRSIQRSVFSAASMRSHLCNQGYQRIHIRWTDIPQLDRKEALVRDRARINDEMRRGYFADLSEMKKHGGKIALANKVLIPSEQAVKFPSIKVTFASGETLELPLCSEQRKDIAPVSIVCLSFRANSQLMIESWTRPFINAFRNSTDIHLYEVSLIDSWFLSLAPVRRLLLRRLRKPELKQDALHRQCAYSFGDHYYFRKKLKIPNMLTGYIFLLDRFGLVRWQGFGSATEEEIISLLSCTSQLLDAQ